MKQALFPISSIFRISFISILLLLVLHSITAQKNLKYKDVYEVVSKKSKEEAYSLLMVFQKQEPFHANTYLQLGLISQFWSKDYDALTNLPEVELFIYNTGLYFGLANSKTDQKEVRKNGKFYHNIKRFSTVEKIDFEEVKTYITEQLNSNNEYKKNVRIVTNLFNQSISHYNNCINIFKEINTSNNKIKDIYLTATPDFIVKLDELTSSFDSTVYYLQNYQTAVRNYPIKSYNQKYKLFPIETYRLHGLTSSDFLMDEISIWNYGKWVKDIKKVINSDISELRTLIDKADKQLNSNANFLLQTNDYNVDFKLPKVDSRLKYKIGKYDHKSLLLELIKYKESKNNFLKAIRNPLNNPEDISSYTIVQKARYYEFLINMKVDCDSLNENFKSKINNYDLNKYNEFFVNNYGGEAGLNNYSKNEKTLLESSLNSSLDNYKNYIVTSKDSLSLGTFKYKNASIELRKSVADFDDAKIGKYYTHHFEKNTNGDYYITGFIKQKAKTSSAFIAKTNKLVEVDWVKLLPLNKTGHNLGAFVRNKENGCEVIISLINNSSVKNVLLGFDKAGKRKEKIELGIGGYPRYFNFDDINQKYLMVFKGIKPDAFDCLEDNLNIYQYDRLTKKQDWKQSIQIKGTFVDIIKMNQDIFLFTNFTSYQAGETTLKSQAGTEKDKTNTLLVILDENGKIKSELPILKSSPFYITNAIKINSNTLNLVGFKNELKNIEQTDNNELGQLLYLLLDSKGNLYHSNWK